MIVGVAVGNSSCVRSNSSMTDCQDEKIIHEIMAAMVESKRFCIVWQLSDIVLTVTS